MKSLLLWMLFPHTTAIRIAGLAPCGIDFLADVACGVLFAHSAVGLFFDWYRNGAHAEIHTEVALTYGTIVVALEAMQRILVPAAAMLPAWLTLWCLVVLLLVFCNPLAFGFIRMFFMDDTRVWGQQFEGDGIAGSAAAFGRESATVGLCTFGGRAMLLMLRIMVPMFAVIIGILDKMWE